MLMGEKSRLPVFQTVYAGRLKEVSTFKTMIGEASCYVKGKRLVLVMDKGFYSASGLPHTSLYGVILCYSIPYKSIIQQILTYFELYGVTAS
jgi:hypothetical protein